MNEAQLRTLKKYLKCLGTELPDVKLDADVKGQKKAYRQILEIIENPKERLSHIVENNLDRIMKDI